MAHPINNLGDYGRMTSLLKAAGGNLAKYNHRQQLIGGGKALGVLVLGITANEGWKAWSNRKKATT